MTSFAMDVGNFLMMLVLFGTGILFGIGFERYGNIEEKDNAHDYNTAEPLIEIIEYEEQKHGVK